MSSIDLIVQTSKAVCNGECVVVGDSQVVKWWFRCWQRRQLFSVSAVAGTQTSLTAVVGIGDGDGASPSVGGGGAPVTTTTTSTTTTTGNQTSTTIVWRSRRSGVDAVADGGDGGAASTHG